MMIKYTNVPMVFDSETFAFHVANEVNAMVDETGYTFDEIALITLGYEPATLKTWMRLKSDAKFRVGYPNMTNFIDICNKLGLDPRNYFVLSNSK